MLDVLGLENAQGHLERDRNTDLGLEAVEYCSNVERQMSRHEVLHDSTAERDLRGKGTLSGQQKKGSFALAKIRYSRFSLRWLLTK
jgi:hypothetical protein